MTHLERITLAAREEWILSTRGKDLPRQQTDDAEMRRQHERARERMRAMRAKQAQTTAVDKAVEREAEALRRIEAGEFRSVVARWLGVNLQSLGWAIRRARAARGGK